MLLLFCLFQLSFGFTALHFGSLSELLSPWFTKEGSRKQLFLWKSSDKPTIHYQTADRHSYGLTDEHSLTARYFSQELVETKNKAKSERILHLPSLMDTAITITANTRELLYILTLSHPQRVNTFWWFPDFSAPPAGQNFHLSYTSTLPNTLVHDQTPEKQMAFPPASAVPLMLQGELWSDFVKHCL